MTVEQIMRPIAVVFDWMRTRTFCFGEYPFTFMEIFVWTMIAGIVIGAIKAIRK